MKIIVQTKKELERKKVEAAAAERQAKALQERTHNGLIANLKEIFRHCPDGMLVYLAKNHGTACNNSAESHAQSQQLLLHSLEKGELFLREQGSCRLIFNPSEFHGNWEYLLEICFSWGCNPGDYFTRWDYLTPNWK